MECKGDEAGERMHVMLFICWRARAALVVVALVILAVVHARIMYIVFEHFTVSRAVVCGVIALMVLKHLGVRGSTYPIRRGRRNRP